jgi:hypothetical protein
MREGGIYHGIKPKKNKYIMKREKRPWYQSLNPLPITYRWKSGERVYCFVAVFAPTEFHATIRHQWQIYSAKQGRWLTTDNLEYEIVGGRAGGYRSYTFKDRAKPGQWRINILTENDRLIGRIRFNIKEVSSETSLPKVTQIK